MACPARFVLRVVETKSVCHSNIATALAKESISGSTSINQFEQGLYILKFCQSAIGTEVTKNNLCPGLSSTITLVGNCINCNSIKPPPDF